MIFQLLLLIYLQNFTMFSQGLQNNQENFQQQIFNNPQLLQQLRDSISTIINAHHESVLSVQYSIKNHSDLLLEQKSDNKIQNELSEFCCACLGDIESLQRNFDIVGQTSLKLIDHFVGKGNRFEEQKEQWMDEKNCLENTVSQFQECQQICQKNNSLLHQELEKTQQNLIQMESQLRQNENILSVQFQTQTPFSFDLDIKIKSLETAFQEQKKQLEKQLRFLVQELEVKNEKIDTLLNEMLNLSSRQQDYKLQIENLQTKIVLEQQKKSFVNPFKSQFTGTGSDIEGSLHCESNAKIQCGHFCSTNSIPITLEEQEYQGSDQSQTFGKPLHHDCSIDSFQKNTFQQMSLEGQFNEDFAPECISNISQNSRYQVAFSKASEILLKKTESQTIQVNTVLSFAEQYENEKKENKKKNKTNSFFSSIMENSFYKSVSSFAVSGRIKKNK